MAGKTINYEYKVEEINTDNGVIKRKFEIPGYDKNIILFDGLLYNETDDKILYKLKSCKEFILFNGYYQGCINYFHFENNKLYEIYTKDGSIFIKISAFINDSFELIYDVYIKKIADVHRDMIVKVKDNFIFYKGDSSCTHTNIVYSKNFIIFNINNRKITEIDGCPSPRVLNPIEQKKIEKYYNKYDPNKTINLIYLPIINNRIIVYYHNKNIVFYDIDSDKIIQKYHENIFTDDPSHMPIVNIIGNVLQYQCQLHGVIKYKTIKLTLTDKEIQNDECYNCNFELDKTRIFVPCGHAKFCKKCFNNYITTKKETEKLVCPICNIDANVITIKY